jgi:hypothetical protein
MEHFGILFKIYISGKDVPGNVVAFHSLCKSITAEEGSFGKNAFQKACVIVMEIFFFILVVTGSLFADTFL